MATTRQILERWNFPHMKNGGVTLVEREHADSCIRSIMGGPYRFFGYEGFTVHPDNTIQPHLEWSASWSSPPPLEEVLSQITTTPPEVTHFEFVFRDKE